jgi:hypothetical protein
MTGAIVAPRKLLGVAPRARILAIHAFSPRPAVGTALSGCRRERHRGGAAPNHV